MIAKPFKFMHVLVTLMVLSSASSNALARKVLQYSEKSAPVTFDPVVSSILYSNMIVTAVFDTLYQYRLFKEPAELMPNLAEAMPEISKDGLTYTIKIKKGVFFHDDACFPGGKGREVTAEDFVYSMKRNFDPKEKGNGAWLWQSHVAGIDEWKKTADYTKTFTGVQALDKYTIQIKLAKPYPQLMYTLAMGYSAVVPREAVDKYKSEFDIKPVGSGPFVFKSHTSRKTTLEKNPNFRKVIFDLKAHGYDESQHSASNLKKLDGKQIPAIDEVQVHWVTEGVARWNSFTKGNEIMVNSITNAQLDEVLESKSPAKLRKKFADKYQMSIEEELGFVRNDLNMAEPSFGHNPDPKRNERNKALRCAVRKSFNWKTQIDRFYFGIGSAFPGAIHPSLDGYDKNMSRESVTQDIAGAKKLLADNGWDASNLPELVYGNISSVESKQMFELFRGNLVQIGYPAQKIKFKAYPTFGDFAKDFHAKKVPIIAAAWGYDYPDAENTLGLYYGPNGAPGSNSANYSNPAYDALFTKASTMLPSPERTKIYMELNKIVTEDCVSIGSFARSQIFLWHKNVAIWPKRNVIGNVFSYTWID